MLIVGGLGYIGRFLARHIHKNDLASEVRIVDKVLPQLAWLAPEFEEACAGSKFMQADASRERMPSSFFYLFVSCADHCALVLTVGFPPRRSTCADIRPSGRQAVGLCLQLRRRDALFPGGRSLQGPHARPVACAGERGGQAGRQGLRRAQHRHGVQARLVAK